MKKQQNNGGFSLLEVILAMAILAILSIPLLSYFTQSMKYNAMMADKQHATNLAQEVMEDLKKQPQLVESVSAGGFTVPYLTGYVQTGYTPAAAGGSTTAGEVSYYGAADAIGQKYDVEVKVSTDVPENTALVPQVDGIDETKMLWRQKVDSYRKHLLIFPQKMHSMQVQTMSRHRVKVK